MNLMITIYAVTDYLVFLFSICTGKWYVCASRTFKDCKDSLIVIVQY